MAQGATGSGTNGAGPSPAGGSVGSGGSVGCVGSVGLGVLVGSPVGGSTGGVEFEGSDVLDGSAVVVGAGGVVVVADGCVGALEGVVDDLVGALVDAGLGTVGVVAPAVVPNPGPAGTPARPVHADEPTVAGPCSSAVSSGSVRGAVAAEMSSAVVLPTDSSTALATEMGVTS